MGGPPMRFSVYYLCHLFKRYSSVNFEDDHNLMGCSLDQNEFTSQSSGLFNGLEAFGDAPPPQRTSTIFGYKIFCHLCKFCYFSDVRRQKNMLQLLRHEFWGTSSPTFGGLRPQTSYRGAAPGSRWGTYQGQVI